nr:hypothetical protein Iba_chr01bCG7300 [Ipomoea batatas]
MIKRKHLYRYSDLNTDEHDTGILAGDETMSKVGRLVSPTSLEWTGFPTGFPPNQSRNQSRLDWFPDWFSADQSRLVSPTSLETGFREAKPVQTGLAENQSRLVSPTSLETSPD